MPGLIWFMEWGRLGSAALCLSRCPVSPTSVPSHPSLATGLAKKHAPPQAAGSWELVLGGGVTQGLQQGQKTGIKCPIAMFKFSPDTPPRITGH